jgi:hypothetical protein
MQGARLRSVLWFPGPVLAMLVAGWAVSANAGPGLFTLSLFAAVVFLIVVPVSQVVLLCTPWFRGRHVAACVAALSIAALIVLIPAASGVFSFY